MFKKVSYLVLALALFVGAQAFMGCSSSSDDPGPLEGTWESIHGDSYIITANKVTYDDGWDFMSYAGTIENTRKDGSNAGYITVKYTESAFYGADAVGKYIVIHYKNLTSSSVSLSIAYSATDTDFDFGGPGGKTTQSAAETTYTVTGGYFGMHGDYSKAK